MKCSVLGCRNNTHQRDGKSFFCFPKDECRRQIWIKAIKRINFTPLKTSVICEEHFLPICIGNFRTRQTLSSSAIPSENIPINISKDIKTKAVENAFVAGGVEHASEDKQLPEDLQSGDIFHKEELIDTSEEIPMEVLMLPDPTDITGRVETYEQSNKSNLALLVFCTNFAAIKHKDHRRKDASQTPYINHPIGVAAILVNEGNITDPDTIMAAILHDTVEDTDTSLDEIEEHFGRTVRDIVDEVTENKSLPTQERKRLEILKAKRLSHKAKLVKLADKLYNLRDLHWNPPVEWSKERRRRYFSWTKQVVDNLRGTNAELERGLYNVFKEQGLL